MECLPAPAEAVETLWPLKWHPTSPPERLHSLPTFLQSEYSKVPQMEKLSS